jgi:heme exporter protein C
MQHALNPSAEGTRLAPEERVPGARRTGAPGGDSGREGWLRRWWLPITGVTGVVGVGLTVWLGLWVTPPSAEMANLVRLLYVHPPVAWVCYLAFSVTTLASLAYLWPRTRAMGWDWLAGASAEVGVVFAGLTLASGSIWGKPTWGTWWVWDARLTTTAILAVLYVGYLALRRVPADPTVAAKRSAIAAIIAFADVPINYLSVYWWNTLHQTGTVLNPTQQIKVEGIMAWTLLLGFVAFTLVYVWMTGVRFRIAALDARLDSEGLEIALAERESEGVTQGADAESATRSLSGVGIGLAAPEGAHFVAAGGEQ